jgi:hypothetical protein
MIITRIGLFALLLLGSVCVQAQTETPLMTKDAGKEKFKPIHSLGLVIGHALVFEGSDVDGNKKKLNIPLWGIDYNFQFAHKWMLGLHTDLLMEEFVVEKHLANGDEEELVERSYPIAPALMGFYKPNHHWSLGFGVGVEFAKEENYMLNRIALEYGAEIRKGWEVFGSLQYDIRWEAYDTWTVGLGIAKAFGKHAHGAEGKE